jgi:hypothetical protein
VLNTLSKSLNRIQENRLIQWIRDHPIQSIFFASAVLGTEIATPVQPSIELGDDEAAIVLQIFTLIALLMPALAILFQSSLQFSKDLAFTVGGGGVELRYWSAFIVGFGSLTMALIIIVLGRLLILPSILDIAIFLIAIVVAGFALLEVWLASITWTKEYQNLAKGLELFQLVSKLEPILDDPDEMLNDFLAVHELEYLIESENDQLPDQQSRLTDF